MSIEIDELNTVDVNAKKVLQALAEFDRGLLVKGEGIARMTGLSPVVINKSVKVLEKSLFVDNPDITEEAPPYDFGAVQITDFGRDVLEKYG